jgi:small subunit ribosomal protein S16
LNRFDKKKRLWNNKFFERKIFMAITIRLARQGAKKNPQYLIVAIDSEKKREGQYLEKLGYYFPKAATDAAKFKINLPAVQAWAQKGARITPTTKQLLKLASK